MNEELSLKELEARSFVTADRVEGGTCLTFVISSTVTVPASIAVGCTDNCSRLVDVTCERDCDVRSIPVDECF